MIETFSNVNARMIHTMIGGDISLLPCFFNNLCLMKEFIHTCRDHTITHNILWLVIQA